MAGASLPLAELPLRTDETHSFNGIGSAGRQAGSSGRFPVFQFFQMIIFTSRWVNAMAGEINVYVIRRANKKSLFLRYKCPITGERFERSSGETSEKAARKRAGEWEAELRAGGGGKLSVKWEEFRNAYESAMEMSLRIRTGEKIASVFNVIEETMKVDNIKRITPQWLTKFQKRLLDEGRSPATVESHFRHLKAALNWAKEQGIIPAVPQFPKLKQARSAKVMKGRPITGEEFDRMIQAVDEEFPIKPEWKTERIERVNVQRESMKFLLRGLWLSGLRLGESLTLTWDQWADGIRVDLSGEHAFLLIPAESEKGGRDRVFPVTPDFGEFLRSVPKSQRTGFVFNPMLSSGSCRRLDTISKRITRFGELAQIKVDQKGEEITWASAHDLRRAFATRWCMRVPSMVLKELMRHQNISTTEKYYVGQNAEQTAVLLAGLMPLAAPVDSNPDAEKAESIPKGDL
jgi:integrase